MYTEQELDRFQTSSILTGHIRIMCNKRDQRIGVMAQLVKSKEDGLATYTNSDSNTNYNSTLSLMYSIYENESTCIYREWKFRYMYINVTTEGH